MAVMDMDADNLAGAEEKLKRSLAMDPQMSETYFDFGNLDLKKGLFDQAMKEYQQGLEVDPDDANGYYYQGVVYLRLAQWARAQSFLEKALEKDPGITRTRFITWARSPLRWMIIPAPKGILRNRPEV